MSATIPMVGIDLGTTNCAVAYVGVAGRITCIPNFEGDLLTPSAILVQQDGALIGREARKLGPQSPDCFAEAFKRHMGDEEFPLPLGGRAWRPEMLSALVLKRLRNDVERTLGGAKSAIITVPAYFDEGRRRATQNAGAIAGWDVEDIINEPNAAAIAFAHAAGELGNHTGTQRVLVYDLGGGTFDTTILEIRDNREYRAIATDGEVRLGGCDWDEMLREHLAELFRNKMGVNPLASPLGAADFLRLAQQAKHRLSQVEKASLPAVFQGKRMLLEVTRNTFESLTAPLLERTRAATEELLEQAKMTWKDIDRVLAVGGSVRMPMVGRMLEEMTGKAPDRSLSADEAVAQGAAVYAQLRSQAGCPRVINVNSHALRVVGRNREGKRAAAELIPRNTPLPASCTKLIPVQKAGMTEVYVPICEGPSDDPSLCELVGQVKVSGIPADGRRWFVGVTLRYRPDGNVEVEAAIRDPDDINKVVGRVSATLVPQRGLTAEQIAAARSELQTIQIN